MVKSLGNMDSNVKWLFITRNWLYRRLITHIISNSSRSDETDLVNCIEFSIKSRLQPNYFETKNTFTNNYKCSHTNCEIFKPPPYSLTHKIGLVLTASYTVLQK